MDFVRILVAILLPPLGVFLQVGFGGQFWLNVLLTLFGYIPGIVHAVWLFAFQFLEGVVHPARVAACLAGGIVKIQIGVSLPAELHPLVLGRQKAREK